MNAEEIISALMQENPEYKFRNSTPTYYGEGAFSVMVGKYLDNGKILLFGDYGISGTRLMDTKEKRSEFMHRIKKTHEEERATRRSF